MAHEPHAMSDFNTRETELAAGRPGNDILVSRDASQATGQE